jgi:hypothetical protein
MFHRRHMPTYLLAVWLAVDAVLLGLVLANAPWYYGGRQYEAVLAALVLGQFAALAGWIILGEEGIKTTFAGLATGMIVYGAVAGSDFVSRVFEAFVFCALSGAVLGLPLLVARLGGWRFRFDADRPSDALPPYQFSLREILASMLFVGLIAGMWSVTRSWGAEHWTGPAALGPALVGMLLMAFPVPWSIWMAFRLRPLQATLVSLAVVVLWCVVFIRLMRPGWPYVVMPATLIAHLLALRLAGFRLQAGEPPNPFAD